jgi:Sugar kinases, ribokinase family
MSFTVIGIGEVVWDFLPAGPQLGGAPANFAFHARSFGANGLVVTRIGNDSLGRDALRRFRAMDVPETTVQIDDELPTGKVTVALSGPGIPQFTIHENAAWDRIAVTDLVLAAVRHADAVCFGSLAQRTPESRDAIQQLVAAAPDKALKLFDINLRQSFYSPEMIERSLDLASVLKVNDTELCVLRDLFSLHGEVRSQMEQLAIRFALKVVVLTCGSGISLIYQEGHWSERPSRPVVVADTVGAGDAFAATLTMGLLHKWKLNEIHALSAEVARYVCSQAGATPTLPEEFRASFDRRPDNPILPAV